VDRTGTDDDEKAIVRSVEDSVDGVTRRHHNSRRGQGARYFAHDLLRRTQLSYFVYSKIVCRAQHGYGSCFEDLPAKQKAAKSGGCSDFLLQFFRLSAILPPPASCRS
jgi:hypothetical protein